MCFPLGLRITRGKSLLAGALEIKLLPALHTCSLDGPACGRGQCLLFRGRGAVKNELSRGQYLSPICTAGSTWWNKELLGQALPGLAVAEDHCFVLLSSKFYLETVPKAIENCKNRHSCENSVLHPDVPVNLCAM